MAEFKFKKIRAVNRPLLKFKTDEPLYVKAEKPMYKGKEIAADKAKEGDKKKEPAMLLDVIDLTTGEEAQIILSAVVQSVLKEEYPSDKYVGKCFSMTKKGRAPGKSYDQYTVVEIEVETDKGEETAALKGKK